MESNQEQPVSTLDEEATRTLLNRFAAVPDPREALERYRNLVDELSRQVRELEGLHQAEMQCRPGCDSCCRVDRTVLPIEAFRLWLEAVGRGISQVKVNDDPGVCPLLVGGLCTLYEARPVICRTHGLPLLYEIEGDLRVLTCSLNFRDRHHFDPGEVLDMREVNRHLLATNAEFVAEHLPPGWEPPTRVRLRTLFQLLRAEGG